MDIIFQAVIIGILQGLTEFIPVSSSAHLELAPWIAGWDGSGLIGSQYFALLAAVEKRLRAGYAHLDIQYRFSPPFRPLTPEEDEEQVEAIKAAGVRVLLVALGCPKQERWMLEHRDRLPVTMLGIGAAVDFVTGAVQPAPRVLQAAGLEWVHRLFAEPRRLWKRYARTNTRFLLLATAELLRESRRHRAHVRGGS